jgi:hypothetical protein
LYQNGGLSVLSSIGETDKSEVGVGRQSYCFSQKLSGEKGSVRRCVVVMQQPVLLSPKVRGKFFEPLHAVAAKRHISKRNWLFDLPGPNVCEKSPWCQRKLWACSWLFFGLPWTEHLMWTPVYGLCFLIIARVSGALFQRSAQNLMLLLCWIYANSHQASTSTKLREIFVHSLQSYANTIIYRCIILLQQLYRW